MSPSLNIHKLSKSCWVIKPKKAKQKESNQTWSTWDGWVSSVGEKNSRPTNLAIIRGPVSYIIYFKVQRSFPSPLMGSQVSARVSMESWYQLFWPRYFSVSVSWTFQSWSRYWDLDIFGLVIETQTVSVSVSVSLLRLRHFQSLSWWSKSGLPNPCLV